MKNIFRHILLLACAAIFFVICTSASVFADESPVSEEIQAPEVPVLPEAPVLLDSDEVALLELINAARRDPLGMAESLGMNRNKILEDFPDLEDILINGLPSLINDNRLNQSARKHNLDMLGNGYYAYDSIDGTNYEQRMISEGYLPSVSGESLGLIFFKNFIGPDQAVLQIFENMFRDELNPELVMVQNILNPEVSETGVSIGGGIFRHSSGFSANAYMAVCDFARPVEIYELQLLNLINQLRADPLPVLAEYGVDANPEVYPEFEILLTDGLPPLAYDLSLYSGAEELVVDMFKNHHFSAKTSDGRTLEDRVTETGYASSWLGESRYRLSTCGEPISPVETVSRMFRYLVNRAFQADLEKRSYAMLTPLVRDCGIRIMAGESAELSGICGDYLHIMVADFGARVEFEDSEENTESDTVEEDAVEKDQGRLIGLVYEDADENGIYSTGEGLSGKVVTIDRGGDLDIEYEIRTNAAGGYALSLPAGGYRVTVTEIDTETETKLFSKWIRINEGASAWLPAVVQLQEITETVDP